MEKSSKKVISFGSILLIIGIIIFVILYGFACKRVGGESRQQVRITDIKVEPHKEEAEQPPNLGLFKSDLSSKEVVKPIEAPRFGGNSGFVTTDGTHFVLNNERFFYVGCNTYYLMVYAANPSLRRDVDKILKAAVAMGLKVLRTWAYNDGANQWNALQTSPGVYQERVFQGLDYVLYKADELGLRLILVLVNNWDDYGGMKQYVDWSPTAISHDDFYTDPSTKRFFKNHISAVLNRKNVFNGRIYKNDPTIFAWELSNEARAQTDPSGDTLNDWIIEMSSYIEEIDQNHLVTTGVEGFYNENSGPWYRDGSQGADFIRNHKISTIDFCTLHLWPDQWGWDYEQSITWVREHIDDAHNVIGKPIILEEFGKYRDTMPPVPEPSVPTGGTGNTATRDLFYQGIYDILYNNKAGGSNFWILYHDSYPDYDGLGVYCPDKSTVDIISAAAAKFNALSAQ